VFLLIRKNNGRERSICRSHQSKKIKGGCVFGKKCVGCGFCCQKAQCYSAPIRAEYGDICPHLIWSKDDKRYYCDVVMGDTDMAKRLGFELAIGLGCCCGLNSWRKDVKERNIRDEEKYRGTEE
jgi:hypothetical protein